MPTLLSSCSSSLSSSSSPYLSSPQVWCIADALRHLAPTTLLHHFGKTQLRSIQRPLAYLQYFEHGVFKAIASFPIDDDMQIEVGVKVSGEFVILTHRGEVDPYEEPDWAFLGGSLVAQARPLLSLDRQVLRSHVRRRWAGAMEIASSARRLSALLNCWAEQGVHWIEAGVVTALYKLAEPEALRLLRSGHSRSVGVYNWLCVAPSLQATRHAGLLVEPAFVAHALCHPGFVTERLLKAVDMREPLRSAILNAFDLDQGQARFLNSVVGPREVSAEVFDALMEQVAPLAPQLRPTTYKAAVELARTYLNRLTDALAFLFAARITESLGTATALLHRQAVARTWRQFVVQRQAALGNPSHRPYQNPFDVDAQAVWQDDPDFEDEPEPPNNGWPALDGGGELDLQEAGLTADECFGEWLLGMTRGEMLQLHIKLCRLSLRKRQGYIEHWRYSILVCLQRFTALPQVVEKLVAGLSESYGFTSVAGQVAEFITADELAAWSDDDWRLDCLTCKESFRSAAMELDNCIDDPAYLHKALVLGALYMRLCCVVSEEETLLELELTRVGPLNAKSGAGQSQGMRFSIARHLGALNRPASLLSRQKSLEFVDWLNHGFNHTPRGSRIARLQEQIKFAIAGHLVAHRWENLNAAAWRVHRQGLRWTPLR